MNMFSHTKYFIEAFYIENYVIWLEGCFPLQVFCFYWVADGWNICAVTLWMFALTMSLRRQYLRENGQEDLGQPGESFHTFHILWFYSQTQNETKIVSSRNPEQSKNVFSHCCCNHILNRVLLHVLLIFSPWCGGHW